MNPPQAYTLFLFPLYLACSPSSIMKIKENSKMLQEYGMCMYYYENDCVCVSVCAQSCLTICDPVDCSLLEKAMAPHSSSLAWRVPWTEEPGGLQSMGSRRFRHD